MRSGVPPDAGKAQESLLEAVVVILEAVPPLDCNPCPQNHSNLPKHHPHLRHGVF